MVRLGFEVRVELTDKESGTPFVAEITRGDSQALSLREGDEAFARVTRQTPLVKA